MGGHGLITVLPAHISMCFLMAAKTLLYPSIFIYASLCCGNY
nr:MAG TPA: hypothetical protein [Bacteriophage sp.]